ncbi:Ribokinase-like protein [Aspergillus pseudodeflectus]|uniref:Ribokinase-like protein n=1 Tax=Aspergillus pseudodeflectus TaxID=176178 RepID=A0ABR4KDV5_9EURO
MVLTPNNQTCFLSLGLVVLDEIRLPGQEPLINVLGGSGAYATLGARLFLPAPASRSVGWLLRVGRDFPESTIESLERWDVRLFIDKESERPSTRGLLEYKDTTFGPKTFKYTTTPLHVSINSLKKTPLLSAKAFHFLESPQNITGRVSELLMSRSASSFEPDSPLIIWEPAPLSCKAENLAPCLQVLQGGIVDVFSPNHIELAALFGEETTPDIAKIESLALRMLNSRAAYGTDDGSDRRKRTNPQTIVIRAGEHGCLVCGHNLKPTWLPPFYEPSPEGGQNAEVVDPTGAGNAFLGGYAVGYVTTGNHIEAGCYGAVAASFALEQVGVPVMMGKGDEETWNGERVLGRLEEYRRRVGLSGNETRAVD